MSVLRLFIKKVQKFKESNENTNIYFRDTLRFCM